MLTNLPANSRDFLPALEIKLIEMLLSHKNLNLRNRHLLQPPVYQL